ncbi:hypothetical protein PQX77_015568 [Marasmius sp. AFHP31]|nr:hypothetical protein PQX77_015568 [Marasmius sp. AFHP31]
MYRRTFVYHTVQSTTNQTDTTSATNTASIATTTAPSRIPAIIGGIVGGVVAFIIVTVIILILLLRRCRHRRQAQEPPAEPQPAEPLGSPYNESFVNSPTSATSLLATVGQRKSTSSSTKGSAENHPPALNPLRLIPPSVFTGRGDLENEEKGHGPEAPSNLQESGLVKDTIDQDPFATETPDETGGPEPIEPAPEDANEPDPELDTRNPVVSSNMRITSAGPSMIDNEELVTRLEYMAQRIAWLELEGRSPPQYTQ